MPPKQQSTVRLTDWVLRFALIALGIAIVSGLNAQAEIYQWRDEAGRIQFGDKPPTSGAKPIQLKQAPKPSAPAETAEARRARTQRLLNEYATERDEREAALAKEQAALIERRQACVAARDRLYDLESSSVLYSRDSAGNKQYLPEVELRNERERARAQVKALCKGDADGMGGK
jgi:Domain of unknown function (DUF4124)